MASRTITQFRPMLRVMQAARFKSSYEIMDHPTVGKIKVAKFRGAAVDGPVYDGWPGSENIWGGAPLRNPTKFIALTIFITSFLLAVPFFSMKMELSSKDKQ